MISSCQDPFTAKNLERASVEKTGQFPVLYAAKRGRLTDSKGDIKVSSIKTKECSPEKSGKIIN